MKNTKQILAFSLIVAALAGATSTYGAAPDTANKPSVPKATPAVPAVPAVPADTSTSPTTPATPATPAIPAVPAKPTTPPPPETGAPTDTTKPTTPNSEIAVDVQKSRDQAQQQRAEYLAKKAELLKELKGADAQAREDLRAKLKDNREAFLTAQRDNRADLRKTVQELKDKLSDHTDAVDNAKEAVKTRKGGA